MKLLDIINEEEVNPIEDYFDSRAPYDRNNRGGTIDYFDYNNEHIMRLTRGKYLFVNPNFYKPLIDILEDRDVVEKTIAEWAKSEFHDEINSAILEHSSYLYYATPNSKIIDPEAKAKHMADYMFGSKDVVNQANRREMIQKIIDGAEEGMKKSFKRKHVDVDRMISDFKWYQKTAEKYKNILKKMNKPE
jgi:hypothetical protein